MASCLECLNLDQQIGTPIVVDNFVGNLELKACVDEVSWFQGRDESILAECNARISSIITKND